MTNEDDDARHDDRPDRRRFVGGAANLFAGSLFTLTLADRATAQSAGNAGSVEDLRGQAFAEKDKVRRDLARAAPVFVHDQIDTGSWSRLTMRLGRDTILKLGEANGDTVFDFQGNGDAAGDVLALSGYGPGATLTQVDATHWQVNYNGGSSHDVITFLNGGAAINPSDYASN